MMIDVSGLAHWVRQHPAAAEINWAFNLHFPLVNIETWYGDSVREYGKLLLWYPQFVAQLTAALPADRVRWYTTSESMRMQLAHFHRPAIRDSSVSGQSGTKDGGPRPRNDRTRLKHDRPGPAERAA